MNELRSFEPFYRAASSAAVGACYDSVTVAASNGVAVATSAPFPGNTGIGPIPNPYRQIRVANKTSVWVHINFGLQGALQAATINSQPFAPGSVEIVTVSPEVSGASVFADGAPAASTSVIFTRGQGT